MPSRIAIRPYRGATSDLVSLCKAFNASLSPEFAIDSRLWLQTVDNDPNHDPGGAFVAEVAGQLAGFVIARVCRVPLGSDGLKPGQGWLHALVVAPAFRRQGVASRLLDAAHAWLRRERVTQVLTGGGPGHLFPGVPEGCTAAQAFFEARGYGVRGDVCYDVQRSLDDFAVPDSVTRSLITQSAFRIHACTSQHVPALTAFLEQTFPGRWLYETQLRLEQERSPHDIMLLTIGSRVAGFAHTYQSRSVRLGPSVFWRRALGPAYGGLGPMGIAPDVRGTGLGLALLAHSVRHLKEEGVENMAIDWTVLLDFYGRCGFTPWRSYKPYVHVLA